MVGDVGRNSGAVKLPSRHEMRERTGGTRQLEEPALLDDPALVEHDDQVRVDDGREAMRDDEGGATVPGRV